MSKKYIYISSALGVATLIVLAFISTSNLDYKFIYQIVLSTFFIFQCYHGLAQEIKYTNYLKTKILEDVDNQEIRDVLITYPKYRKQHNNEFRVLLVSFILLSIILFLSFMFFRAYTDYISSHIIEIIIFLLFFFTFLYLYFRESYIIHLSSSITKHHYNMKIRRNKQITYPENRLISYKENKFFDITAPDYNCNISCLDVYEKEKTFTNNYTQTGFNLTKRILRYHYKLNTYTNFDVIIDKGFNNYELNRLPIEIKPAYDELSKTRIMKVIINKNEIIIERCIKIGSYLTFNTREDVELHLSDTKLFYDKIVKVIENTKR